MSASLVALARRAGCGTAELGAEPRHLRRALRVGGAGAVIVAISYGALLVNGDGPDVFRDRRVTSLGSRTALSHLLLRIPLGTVLPEEVVFRGVLPALLSSSRRPGWFPGAVASVLFGLWHVLPSIELARANVAVGRVVGGGMPARAVTAAVGATTVAGCVLHGLRHWTGHLAAPVAVHLATNVFGFLGARFAGRGR